MSREMAGALYATDEADGTPLSRGVVTVSGVRLNIAVWPKRTARNGREFWPVSLEYRLGETRRLVDVQPVFGVCGGGVADTSSPNGEVCDDLMD